MSKILHWLVLEVQVTKTMLTLAPIDPLASQCTVPTFSVDAPKCIGRDTLCILETASKHQITLWHAWKLRSLEYKEQQLGSLRL